MGRISDEDITRVRDATDVVSLISRTVVLKQKGRLFWGRCPFHGEKTPSFKVDPGTGLWHCFGCGAGGDAFGFIMRSDNVEFPDAVRQLAEEARVEITETGESTPRGHRDRFMQASGDAAAFYHRVLVTSKEPGPTSAREYLASRGFGSDVARRFELGYAPGRGVLCRHLTDLGYTADELVQANLGLLTDSGQLRDRFYERVMFPIRNLQGRTVGFGGRVIGSGEPKYLNTQETPVFHKSENLYAIERARNEIVKAGAAIVVEGYTDVIALHEAGVANAVATLGTALTRKHVKLLGRFTRRIVYLFDADEAGLRAADRAAEFIDVGIDPASGGTAIELVVAVIPDGRDPADYVGSAGAEGIAHVVESARPLMEFVLDRRLAEHDLSTPEGRARALSAAASALASIRGSLLAQDYTNYVADRLRVDFATVQQAAMNAKPAFLSANEEPAGSGDRPAGGETARLDPLTRVQRSLVGLLARDASLRGRARELLEGDLLTDARARRILELIIGAGDAQGEELSSAILSAEPEFGSTLSAMLFESGELGEPRAAVPGVYAKVKELGLERQIIEIKARMRTLDAVKERAEYDELFERRAALEVERGRLRKEEPEDADTKAWG